jgi:hypothetical protein
MKHWTDNAACKGLTELFFPTHGEEGKRIAEGAKQVCAKCPVTKECEELALSIPADEREFAVWAGKTGREFRKRRVA